jgi:hypothetical protein
MLRAQRAQEAQKLSTDSSESSEDEEEDADEDGEDLEGETLNAIVAKGPLEEAFATNGAAATDGSPSLRSKRSKRRRAA